MKQTSMIENFLDGKAQGEEKATIEERISHDQAFEAEVNLHKEVNDAIKEDDIHHFREKIRSIIYPREAHPRNIILLSTKFMKYPIAAAILILISISLWQVVVKRSPEKIYSLFYAPYQTDISTRSGVKSSDKLQLAFLLYQEGDYEKSFRILEDYLNHHANHQTAHFYYGINALELEKYDLAIKELQPIAGYRNTPFSLHAQWYLALTYLKTDQKEAAREYLRKLAESSNLYSKRASSILRKL